MKAIIFAAGLGTRLKDITDDKPKALVEVNGVPLLEIAIRKLKYYGFKDIIVNIHHYSEQIEAFIKNLRYDDLRVTVSDESFKLLGTGGGIKKASGFFSGEEAFLAYNVDVISDLDIGKLYRKHIISGALATLAVRKRDTSRYLLVDDQNIMCGWCNVKTGERIISREKPEELTSMAFFRGITASSNFPILPRLEPRFVHDWASVGFSCVAFLNASTASSYLSERIKTAPRLYHASGLSGCFSVSLRNESIFP